LLEIDTLRIDTKAAVEMFRSEVLPVLEQQPGYSGVLVLTTPEGHSALMSFWETSEQATTDALSGFYPESLERYMTLFKSPPGRARYELAYADMPGLLSA
jgi:hypothetical protein